MFLLKALSNKLLLEIPLWFPVYCSIIGQVRHLNLRKRGVVISSPRGVKGCLCDRSCYSGLHLFFCFETSSLYKRESTGKCNITKSFLKNALTDAENCIFFSSAILFSCMLAILERVTLPISVSFRHIFILCRAERGIVLCSCL